MRLAGGNVGVVENMKDVADLVKKFNDIGCRGGCRGTGSCEEIDF